jgi:hypothetical protein
MKFSRSFWNFGDLCVFIMISTLYIFPRLLLKIQIRSELNQILVIPFHLFIPTEHRMKWFHSTFFVSTKHKNRTNPFY